VKIEKEAEKILEEFSRTLESIPELEETHYIVDNLNRTRLDKSEAKDPLKLLRNAHTDENGNILVEKSKWVK